MKLGMIMETRACQVAIRMANARMDNLARPTVQLLGRRRSSFQVYGIAGFVAAMLIAPALGAITGRSTGPLLLCAAVAVGTFLLLAWITFVVTGRERLVWYHHQIAVIIGSTVVLWATHRPIMGHLDLVVIGLGVFGMLGRIGCATVGCCHGRPSRIGIRYRHDLVDAGFDHRLVGARLAPTQLLEAAAIAAVTVIAIVQLLAGPNTYGRAFTTWLGGYAILRFFIEFLRGDHERSGPTGCGGTQWISLILLWFLAITATTGLLPGSWTVPAAGLLTILTLASVVRWRRAGRTTEGRSAQELTGARHTRELAELLRDAVTIADQPDSAGMAATSRRGAAEQSEVPVANHLAPVVIRSTAGLAVSIADLGGTAPFQCVTLSARPALTRRSARRLASEICALRFPDQPYQLLSAGAGVYHVVLPIGPPATPPGDQSPFSRRSAPTTSSRSLVGHMSGIEARRKLP